MTEFELYNYRRCPFCIRVRLVFLYKNRAFTTKNEQLRNWSEEFKKLFTQKKPSVPVLLDRGKPIFESLDIMEYIEDKHPGLSKKEFRKWGNWSAKELRDAIQMYKYGENGTPEQGKALVMEKLQEIEQALEPNLAGKELGLADFAVWPFVRQALRVQEKNVTLPSKVQQWFSAIENHKKLEEVMKKEKKKE